MNEPTWKEALAATIPADIAREIDDYETDLELRRSGRSDVRLFNETRLRRGVYGQRYDNGSRHDGERARRIAYPSGGTLKGPGTLWDAPGMQRIKIPFGALTIEQMETLADLADEYSTGILHVTTRQDIQMHFVHIDDTPDLMRRLAAVGITTREACGNAVRNVTACPLAGVCAGQAFDVSPHARALTRFLLGHPDAQHFGRKFKVSFSGCKDAACGVAAFHDLGWIARVRERERGLEQGFELWVGGGLGPVPHQAELFSSFVPVAEVLPLSQAVCRVFANLGEKKNRARARLKFLVARLGIDEFRRLVVRERDALEPEAEWTAHLPGPGSDSDQAERDRTDGRSDRHGARPEASRTPTDGRDAQRSALAAGLEEETPLRPPAPLPSGSRSPAFTEWRRRNVRAQPQAGYAVATVMLPLGDLSSMQMRGLARLARESCGDTVRTTIEQNLVFRWLPEAELPRFHDGLTRIGLAAPGAGSIVDVTACPGTDTCKLGIASSRGLAGTLRRELAAGDLLADEAVRGLHIKVSGCFNSCGQHHVADIGFYGVSRNVGGRTVPHFQVVLGGRWEENASAFGLAIGAVPSKRIPRVVRRLADRYRRDRGVDETFREFVRRTGKAAMRETIEDLMEVPDYPRAPDLYTDWADPREYSIGDIGDGECAGEVVAPFDFDIAVAERRVFDAQVHLDHDDGEQAARFAYAAMLEAAAALLRSLDEKAGPADQQEDVGAHGAAIVEAFRTHLVETERFFDPFAGAKFANYLLALHETVDSGDAVRDARARVEEAQLFIEASHGCHARLVQDRSTPTGTRP